MPYTVIGITKESNESDSWFIIRRKEKVLHNHSQEWNFFLKQTAAYSQESQTTTVSIDMWRKASFEFVCRESLMES
jgi:hypothetical protein